MTPDERQLLSGLFDRVRTASNQPRDREAEGFIGDAVRSQPYAPYLLAQTVIVQEQALRAANDKLQELESKVRQYESAPQSQGAGPNDSSFLGSLGRSIFGTGQGENPQPQRGTVPQTGSYGQGSFGAGQQQQPSQGGPWAQQASSGQGGGFLKGALGMAAGVAGGALLGNAISGLFRGNNNPFGITSGMPGFGGGGGYPGGGETIVNNYYDNDAPGGGGGYDQGPGMDPGFDNAADFGPDDGNFGGDDGYNV